MTLVRRPYCSFKDCSPPRPQGWMWPESGRWVGRNVMVCASCRRPSRLVYEKVTARSSTDV